MLRFLGVRHLAVIEKVEVELEPGLTILTGETGAGKSVIVEAIDLLLGGRASTDLIRTGEESATVQAVFERGDGREVIIRREVSAQGRSRAFIDDTLATSGALREIGSTLVELHGQHDHQALLDPTEHTGLLDAFLRHHELLDDVGRNFDAWQAAHTALSRTHLDDREKRARLEIASFQLDEIEKVTPTEFEDETLSAERVVLANADRLGRLSSEAYAALYESDSSALAVLGAVWKRIDELASLDPRFAPYLHDRSVTKAGLEDLAFFLRSYAADLDASPERLQSVEDRLAALTRLKLKYGPTLHEVCAKQHELRATIEALQASEAHIAELEERERSTRDLFVARARALSAARQSGGVKLARALERDLTDLAMPRSRVDVRVTPTEEDRKWTRQGLDEVELFLSANPGEEVRPLARIASGGELSRVMLAIRALVSLDAPGRTLIFDEVDAGIGGAAADAVGARLQALAGHHQVLCVTHLPQIAARATTHFSIAKRLHAGRTETILTKLDDAGREHEIARMIAGATVSAQVLGSAREMLAARRPGESEIKAKGESPLSRKAKGRRNGS